MPKTTVHPYSRTMNKGMFRIAWTDCIGSGSFGDSTTGHVTRIAEMAMNDHHIYQ